MNNKVDPAKRTHFRDRLRTRLLELDFYQRRGDHYLIREFAKYCIEQGAPIDEASLGRYLRDDDPVLPTPERCRLLARVFGVPPLQILIEAGYFEGDDLFQPLPEDSSAIEVTAALEARHIAVRRLQEAALDATFGPIAATLGPSIQRLESQVATQAHQTQARQPTHTGSSSSSSGSRGSLARDTAHRTPVGTATKANKKSKMSKAGRQ